MAESSVLRASSGSRIHCRIMIVKLGHSGRYLPTQPSTLNVPNCKGATQVTCPGYILGNPRFIRHSGKRDLFGNHCILQALLDKL